MDVYLLLHIEGPRKEGVPRPCFAWILAATGRLLNKSFKPSVVIRHPWYGGPERGPFWLHWVIIFDGPALLGINQPELETEMQKTSDDKTNCKALRLVMVSDLECHYLAWEAIIKKNMLQSLLISAHSRIPCNWKVKYNRAPRLLLIQI